MYKLPKISCTLSIQVAYWFQCDLCYNSNLDTEVMENLNWYIKENRTALRDENYNVQLC